MYFYFRCGDKAAAIVLSDTWVHKKFENDHCLHLVRSIQSLKIFRTVSCLLRNNLEWFKILISHFSARLMKTACIPNSLSEITLRAKRTSQPPEKTKKKNKSMPILIGPMSCDRGCWLDEHQWCAWGNVWCVSVCVLLLVKFPCNLSSIDFTASVSPPHYQPHLFCWDTSCVELSSVCVCVCVCRLIQNTHTYVCVIMLLFCFFFYCIQVLESLTAFVEIT